jgi:type II secretory pathway pseudopilin PulG
MKKLNQRGFAALEIVLVIVVLMALAGAGYFVWQKQHDTTSQNSSAKGSVSKSYSDNGISFKYTYPSALKATDEEAQSLQSADFAIIGDGPGKITKGESVTITPIYNDIDQEGQIRHVTFDNYLLTTVPDARDRARFSNLKTVTINGAKALQYDMEESGSENRVTVFFISDTKRIEVEISYPKGESAQDHSAAYDQLINSIQLQ